MKKALLGVLFLIAGVVKGQDIVVIKEGDSLNCKITRMNKDFLYYTYLDNSEIKTRAARMKEVKFYQRNYYKETLVPRSEIKKLTSSKGLTIGFYGGHSYLTGAVDPNSSAFYKSYIDELKSGYHIGGDIAYFFNNHFGAGLIYSLFKTDNARYNVVAQYSNGTSRVGTLSDDITTQYFGPAFYFKVTNAAKTFDFITRASIGYMDYTDNAVYIDPVYITGNTIGIQLGASIDYRFDPHLGITAGLSLPTGFLFNSEATSQGKTIIITDHVEDLTRIDLSLGLRFFLNP